MNETKVNAENTESTEKPLQRPLMVYSDEKVSGHTFIKAVARLKNDSGESTGERISGAVYINFGKDLDEFLTLYPNRAEVYELIIKAAKIDVQRFIRLYLETDQHEKIAELKATWVPGMGVERSPKETMDAALQTFAKLSPEEQKAYMDALMKSQGNNSSMQDMKNKKK